ncbi:hypothetical protein [Pseudobdellovibrio sp. HCB154]|uniref:hypothetical protein n=1 Tax=Pseudobdellovibrio sp. HCB154 TaxID=3386277 RepID=UPI003917564A
MIGHAGFLGHYHAGATYHADDNHSLELSLGNYEMDNRNFFQLNFGYAYSRWHWQIEEFNIEPLRFGPYVFYAFDNSKYFLQVPHRYADRSYYQQSGLHLALHLGSAITIKENLRFIIFTMIIDEAFIIIYNNPGEQIDQTFMSTGIILEWML